jgi:hypothetical protein
LHTNQDKADTYSYASSRSNDRSVPISNTLTGFTTALPVLAGLLLEGGYDFTRRQERRKRLSRGEIQRPPLVIIANTIIFIYSTVVITLLGTHAAPPSGLDCALHSTWQKLFRSKDFAAIRTIQDAFNCCGLMNSSDMAWPFPDKTQGVHACEAAFGRSNGCFPAWKAEEQRVAGLLIGVVAMVFVWQARSTHSIFKNFLLTCVVCHHCHSHTEGVVASQGCARPHLPYDRRRKARKY